MMAAAWLASLSSIPVGVWYGLSFYIYVCVCVCACMRACMRQCVFIYTIVHIHVHLYITETRTYIFNCRISLLISNTPTTRPIPVTFTVRWFHREKTSPTPTRQISVNCCRHNLLKIVFPTQNTIWRSAITNVALIFKRHQRMPVAAMVQFA